MRIVKVKAVVEMISVSDAHRHQRKGGEDKKCFLAHSVIPDRPQKFESPCDGALPSPRFDGAIGDITEAREIFCHVLGGTFNRCGAAGNTH
jgi:hypothetical protein